MQSFFENTFKQFYELFRKHNESIHLAKYIYKKVFHHLDFEFEKDTLISKSTALFLKENFNFTLPEIKTVQSSNDGTYKILFSLHDQKTVECVLIPFFKKYTICISSQVGCAMQCSFCFTGTQGLKRHLESFEIVLQYLIGFQYLKTIKGPLAPKPNIVFMGQGEPLHNFENVKKAIECFLDVDGIHLGPRQLTLSTSGYLPGLKRFNELHQINLAISLHAPKNQIRDQLIPINKTYPLEDLFSVLETIKLKKKQFITFEYLLIDQLNNDFETANELIDLLKNKRAIVNIIPFNPFPGSKFLRPSTEQVLQFKHWIGNSGIPTLVRTTKGDEILAACGQLRGPL